VQKVVVGGLPDGWLSRERERNRDEAQIEVASPC